MFYWFTKGDQVLHYEAREVSPTCFELTISGPDQQQRVEQFTTAEALHAPDVALTQELETAGWTGPVGWKL